FGWNAIELDGHDLAAIDAAYSQALRETERPTCLIARTEKGHGVSFLANKDGWHGKALSPEQAAQALQELGMSEAGVRHLTVRTPMPEQRQPAHPPPAQPLKLPVYEPGN